MAFNKLGPSRISVGSFSYDFVGVGRLVDVFVHMPVSLLAIAIIGLLQSSGATGNGSFLTGTKAFVDIIVSVGVHLMVNLPVVQVASVPLLVPVSSGVVQRSPMLQPVKG